MQMKKFFKIEIIQELHLLFLMNGKYIYCIKYLTCKNIMNVLLHIKVAFL